MDDLTHPTPLALVRPPLPIGEATEEVGEATEGVGAMALAVVPLLANPALPTCPALNNEELPVGGRLALFKDRWHFSPWAVSVISNGLGWKWRSSPPKLRRFYQRPTPFLREYVDDLLARRVVCPAKSLSFQGRLFCVPRNTPPKRVILDLSVLNLHIQCDKFQRLPVTQIRTLLPPGTYAISIDLADAYWRVPVARHSSPTLDW